MKSDRRVLPSCTLVVIAGSSADGRTAAGHHRHRCGNRRSSRPWPSSFPASQLARRHPSATNIPAADDGSADAIARSRPGWIASTRFAAFREKVRGPCNAHRGDRGDRTGGRNLAASAPATRLSPMPGCGSTRARAPTVGGLPPAQLNRARFEATGHRPQHLPAGRAARLTWIAVAPSLLDRAEMALHCKDWLYLNLTGVRATDPSGGELHLRQFPRPPAMTTRSSRRSASSHRRALLPEIIDGTRDHPSADRRGRGGACGLLAGTPVCLGYVDMVMTALGAGVLSGEAQRRLFDDRFDRRASCAQSRSPTFISTAEGTGYVIALPIPGIVTQVQTNMGATINIDWLLGDRRLSDGARSAKPSPRRPRRADRRLVCGEPARVGRLPSLYLRGRRAWSLRQRQCAGGLYRPVGQPPRVSRPRARGGRGPRRSPRAIATRRWATCRDEIRLTGGAARSRGLRTLPVGRVTQAPVRVSSREESGCGRRRHDGCGGDRRLSRQWMTASPTGSRRCSATPRTPDAGS